MKFLKRNLKTLKIITIITIILVVLTYIGSCAGKLIYRGVYHPCQYYSPYQIISGFIRYEQNITKYIIRLKGLRKDSNEECEYDMRVSEKKYYELIEKDRK